MRRVVAILLAIVLVPSIVMATLYRCVDDGTLRTSCCCPEQRGHDKAPTPTSGTSLKSSCCCEVIHAASVSTSARAISHAAPDVPSALVAVTTAPQPVSTPIRVALDDRSLCRGGPPEPLFVRHCSLLL